MNQFDDAIAALNVLAVCVLLAVLLCPFYLPYLAMHHILKRGAAAMLMFIIFGLCVLGGVVLGAL